MKQLHNRVDRRLLKERIEQSPLTRTTVSFYKYAKIGNPRIFRDHLYSILSTVNVLGRIYVACLLYTSPSPRDRTRSRMPSSA